MPAHNAPPLHCDIFCKVIDNLGDAGVCWRLARQLAGEYGWRVRLIIDDPEPISLFGPNAEDLGLEIIRWTAAASALQPAAVVIEAFACDPPADYIQAMAAMPRAPLWLNLEYLATEPWAANCHGLPSPHPRLPLTKYFFVPGFSPGCGGLIRGALPEYPRPRRDGDTLEISLFCYDNPALPRLLDCWRDGNKAIICHVTAGLANQQLQAWLGKPLEAGVSMQLGALTIKPLPFLSQDDYDALLARCHLNFVRGEDSFVRSQWLKRPFIWQAYRQHEEAHLAKVEAFLKLYCKDLSATSAQPLQQMFRVWNQGGDVAAAWSRFLLVLPALEQHATAWSYQLTRQGDLVGKLLAFCIEKL